MELTDLFKADTILKDVNSLDKSMMEIMALSEQLDKKGKTAFYSFLDAFNGKKKLKEALGNVLQSVE